MSLTSVAARKTFPLNTTITIRTVALNTGPCVTVVFTVVTNDSTKLVANFLVAGLRVPDLLTNVLAVANLCSVGLHIVKETGVDLLNGGAVFAIFRGVGLPERFSAVALNLLMIIVVVKLCIVFFGARFNRTIVTANSGRTVTHSLNVSAGAVGVIKLVVSGKVITLTKSVVTRSGNCTSVDVNVKAVIVNLTSVVVNRMLFAGISFGVHLIYLVLNSILCQLVVIVMLRTKVGPGSFGLVSTMLLAFFLTLPGVGRACCVCSLQGGIGQGSWSKDSISSIAYLRGILP